MKEKISFNFDKMTWENITIDQVKFWEGCYPDVDVIEHLTKRMPAWLDGNPGKAHKKQWKRFIVNWLSNQQDGYNKFKKKVTK
jgi:hypothetical protein